MSALVLGATGLCGGAILKHASECSKLASVYSITRREIPSKPESVNCVVEKDTSVWASLIPDDIQILFTGLATTKANVGGFDKQYKIDHDLNIDLAKAAKEKGCKTIVVITSTGANVESHLPYYRMKGEIERDILEIGFDKTIFLRPGPLIGNRETNNKGLGNDLLMKVGSLLHRSSLQRFLAYPVNGDEVGNAAVQLATNEDDTEAVKYVSSREILELAGSA